MAQRNPEPSPLQASEPPSERQLELAQLIAQARQMPGVADAADLYERVRGRAATVATANRTVRYATGGNE